MRQNKTNIQDLCMTGLMAAVISIMAQITIPMPFGVPFTMQTFAITLVGIILGAKKGLIACFIYISLGVIGLPVFSNFTGGWQTLFGPTGGFLLSFPIMTFLIGLGTEFCHKFKGCFTLFLTLGTCVNFLCGASMFCFLTNSTFETAFLACVLPFIPVSILKAFLASVLGLSIRKRLFSIQRA